MFVGFSILMGLGTFQSALRFTEKGVYHNAQKPCQLARLPIVLTQADKRRLMSKSNVSRASSEEALAGLMASPPLPILE